MRDPDSLQRELDEASADRRRALRETLVVALATLLAVGAGILGLWVTETKTHRDDYGDHLTSLAIAAAQQVDPELHRSLRDPAQLNGPDYMRAVSPLRRMRDALTEVKYVYTMVRRDGQAYLVLDAADPGEEQAGLWEPYDETDPAMEAAFGSDGEAGRPAATDRPYSDKWGSFMTGWAPLLDAQGRQYGVLGVDVDASKYLAHVADARFWALVGVLPAALLVAALSMGFFRVRLRGLAAAREALAAAAELRREQQRLHSVVEGTGVGTWESVIDPAQPGNRLLTVDARWAATIGRRPEEVANLTPARFYSTLMHPDDVMTAKTAVERAMREDGHLLEIDVRLRHADGHWVWTQVRGKVIERDSQGRPLRMVGTQMDNSARKALELELTDAARHDRLTGLANRALFMERLHAAVERVRRGVQDRFAVLFLDFDRFKLVNDTMGHDAGDELLREIAARLRNALRQRDDRHLDPASNLIARFGGDEFLVLLNDLPDSSVAERIADRLLATLSEPYSIQGRDVYSTASIGIVTSEQSLESAEAVISKADMAMYEAKRSGRARAEMFGDTMRVRVTRYVSIDSSLRKALGTPEFSLAYQPVVELASRRVVSVEALARWQHPQLGQVPPSEFIQVAEETGLIDRLGQWVLREACRQLAAWRAQDPVHAPQAVCVNVSRAELARGDVLLQRVRETLRDTGLPPGCLQLEVTEGDLMSDPETTLTLTRSLRELGVRLAMDDFGTGTSSLACLRDYPFDIVKIDQSFISDAAPDPDKLAVLQATISLVENLGKTSVAEGVETRQQVAMLHSLGCQYAQGEYFSPPLTPPQMSGYMLRPFGEALSA